MIWYDIYRNVETLYWANLTNHWCSNLSASARLEGRWRNVILPRRCRHETRPVITWFSVTWPDVDVLCLFLRYSTTRKWACLQWCPSTRTGLMASTENTGPGMTDINYVIWGKGGNVTSAGWQVTLCDTIYYGMWVLVALRLAANSYTPVFLYLTLPQDRQTDGCN